MCDFYVPSIALKALDNLSNLIIVSYGRNLGLSGVLEALCPGWIPAPSRMPVI